MNEAETFAEALRASEFVHEKQGVVADRVSLHPLCV